MLFLIHVVKVRYFYTILPDDCEGTQVVFVLLFVIAKLLLCNHLMYCIVLYCIVLYCIVLYCIVLYCIVLYCIVLYCIVLYCIGMYCMYWYVLYVLVLPNYKSIGLRPQLLSSKKDICPRFQT